jgi:hypothetical protein
MNQAIILLKSHVEAALRRAARSREYAEEAKVEYEKHLASAIEDDEQAAVYRAAVIALGGSMDEPVYEQEMS